MQPLDPSHPNRVAQAAFEAMWANDHASHAMGMQVHSVGPGTATVSMVVRQDMLNGHATCHGGLIAMLADSAFACACNSYNELTVASGFDINLVSGALLGDVLTAVVTEINKAGRTGVYDVAVSNQRGQTVAAFRGRSYTVKGKALVDGLPVGKAAMSS